MGVLRMKKMFRLLLIMLLVLPVSSLFGSEEDGLDSLQIGKTYFNGGEFKKAAREFSRVVTLQPENAQAHAWLGKAYLRLGDNGYSSDPECLERAAAEFKEALRILPDCANARFDLGMAYLALDNRKAAVEECEKLEKLDKKLAGALAELIRGYVPPQQFRAVGEKGSRVTQVTIRGNQVLVPATLACGEHVVQAVLLLDTGATVTSISPEVAGRLHLDLSRAQTIRGQVVGGGVLEAKRARLSSLTVGPNTKADMDIAVIPHHGPAVGYDGLLGMNFLRNLRYAIDFQERTIHWE